MKISYRIFGSRVLVRLYSLFFLFFLCLGANAKDLVDTYLDEISKKADYLYIEHPTDIENLEGVIYVTSTVSVDESVKELFVNYSKNLSDKFGGVILSTGDEFFMSYLSSSSCETTSFTDSSLIFENRNTLKCYYFQVDKDEELITALVTVDKHIKDSKDILVPYSKQKLRKILDSIDYTIVTELSDEIVELFDFLISKGQQLSEEK